MPCVPMSRSSRASNSRKSFSANSSSPLRRAFSALLRRSFLVDGVIKSLQRDSKTYDLAVWAAFVNELAIRLAVPDCG